MKQVQPEYTFITYSNTFYLNSATSGDITPNKYATCTKDTTSTPDKIIFKCSCTIKRDIAGSSCDYIVAREGGSVSFGYGTTNKGV